MANLSGGWVEYPVQDHQAARKWFGDHYKTVEVADGGDLEGACAAIDAEAEQHAQATVDANKAAADALRAEADALEAPPVVAPEPPPAAPDEPAAAPEPSATEAVSPDLSALAADPAAETPTTN